MTEEETEELMRAYAITLGSPAAQAMLMDLEIFCHVLETSAVPGDRDRTLMNEGRREVFLRMMKFSKVTMSDLYDLRLGRKAILRTNEGEDIHG